MSDERTGPSDRREFILGEHDAEIRRLVEGQESMGRDIREIRDILSSQKGERRAVQYVLHTLSAIIGAVAALLAGHFKGGA